MPRPVKLGLYFLSWGVVILVAFIISPWDMWKAPGFPIGFLGLLPGEISVIIAGFGGWLVAGAGWVVYCLLTDWIFGSKRISTFWLLYAILCILLALNLVGCRTLLNRVSGIH